MFTVPAWWTEEPLKRLVTREGNQQLAGAIAELDHPLQELWHVLALGLELGEAARYLGISYDQAKRQRQKLFAALRKTLTATE